MGGVENEQKITELDLKGIISEEKNSLIKQAFVLPENIDFIDRQNVKMKTIGNKNFEILVVDYETDDYNNYNTNSNNTKYEIQRSDDGSIKELKPIIQAEPAAAGPAVPAAAESAAAESSPVNDEGGYNDEDDV